MKINVIGFTNFEYEKDGRKVKGTNIFALEPITSAFGSGEKYVGFFEKGSYRPLSVMDSVFPSKDWKIGTYDFSFEGLGSSKVSQVKYIG